MEVDGERIVEKADAQTGTFALLIRNIRRSDDAEYACMVWARLEAAPTNSYPDVARLETWPGRLGPTGS